MQSLISWQASIPLSDAIKNMSKLGTLKHFTLNLGGYNLVFVSYKQYFIL